MAVTKRTITVETWQRTVIRQSSQRTPRFWCAFCADHVEMITARQAVIVFDISLHKVYQGIEKGRLHFIEKENQSPSICVNSLKNYQ